MSTTKIVAIASQKGGAGKTTSCICLADAFAQRGLSVLLLDADEQESLVNWSETAEEGMPRVIGVKNDQIMRLKEVRPPCDLVLIDCPGFLEGGTRAALSVADFALVPMRPAQLDVRALDNTLSIIAKATDKYFKRGSTSTR